MKIHGKLGGQESISHHRRRSTPLLRSYNEPLEQLPPLVMFFVGVLLPRDLGTLLCQSLMMQKPGPFRDRTHGGGTYRDPAQPTNNRWHWKESMISAMCSYQLQRSPRRSGQDGLHRQFSLFGI